MVQRRCPEWSDHNVSDPGVTLIETFAYMVDQLIYRLNRVPDRHYLKFLDLLGVRLFPPTSARVPVTFWLSARQGETIPIAAGTEVTTLRTATEEEVSFTTIEHLDLVSCERAYAASALADDRGTGPADDRTADVNNGQEFSCFGAVPQPGDALYVGLTAAVPSCAIAMRIACRTEGVGVDPRNPPLVWEAWDGAGWTPCEVERDETGGLNVSGDVVLHVPKTHVISTLPHVRLTAGWLRCVVVPASRDQPVYSMSPRVSRVEAFTIGGTVDAVNATVVVNEILGISEGVAGQRFQLARRPVVPSEAPMILEVAGGDAWEQWESVESFAQSDATSRHFLLDASAGEIVLGPAVRENDGTITNYGAVPPKGAPLRIRSYRSGGGVRGNVARRTISVVKSSIPFVTRVENRRPATGGVEGETVEAAKQRGPILLRTRDRAVTTEDYEQLARQAAPEVARARCVPADEGEHGVRLLIVPAVEPDEQGRLSFERLVPAPETLTVIRDVLDRARLVGTRVSVEPPFYTGVTVVARVRARLRADETRVLSDALRALYGYFNPVTGGPDGEGWPYARPVHAGEVYGVLQRIDGVEFVEDARLYGANPLTGERTEAVPRIDLDAHALVFSYEHQVRVVTG